MKLSLLELLACPDCFASPRGSGDPAPLALREERREGEDILEGALTCAACGRAWPIRRGVPRFVDLRGDAQSADESAAETASTAAAFGWEWQAFRSIDPHHEQQFLDWIAPATADSFRDCVVLEGGCGKGRHTRLVASYGARAILGVDLSDAVDVAFDDTRGMPNAHIIQADLRRLPLRPGSIDHAYSVGVLHHLPLPREGFDSLARALRPGGTLSVWVYGAENNLWIARVVSPIRTGLTSRIPARLLYGLAWVVSVPLWAALKTLYRPARREGLAWMRRGLFYYPYLSYISKFPFREIHHIVHDHLAAPVAHYLTRDEVVELYHSAGIPDARVEWHNRNSWRGWGRRNTG